MTGKTAAFTKIGLGMLAIAFIVDLTLYLAHASEGLGWDIWPTYALMDLLFVVVGTLGVGYLTKWKIGKDDVQTFMQFGYIFITIFLVQFAVGVLTQMSFTRFEQALYYVFAGTAEEVFFRGFVILGILRISNKTKGKFLAALVSSTGYAAVIISTAGFALIHVNYYNDFQAMLGVIIGGVVLAIYFIVWRNLTANMIAHTFLNFIRSFQFLVYLAAPGLAIASINSGGIQLGASILLAIVVAIQFVYVKVKAWKGQKKSD